MTRDGDRTRRTVLRTATAAAAALLAGCTGSGGGTATAPESGGGDGGNGNGNGNDGSSDDSDASGSGSGGAPSFDGWLSNASNYDGVVDRTGASEVTVKVGVEANGGAFGFGPAAVRVDPGTTVVWEWTGEGSMHDVVAKDGRFESEQTDEAGHTYARTFEETGTTKYACTPHRTLGMKGVVVVRG
jgi:halocyanin-like protein